MKATMKATSPDTIEYTMQVTMPLAQWKEIRKAMAQDNRSPLWEFRQKINEVVAQAEKEYAAKPETGVQA